MTTACQPHQGIKTICAQVEDYVAFAVFPQKPMDKMMTVDAFLVVVKATGQYQTYTKEWMQLHINQ